MFKSIIKKQKDTNQKGITLIALIVTIIVLLILAGITIATLTGEDGLINNANNAKEETEIANEKEIVDRATVNAMGNNNRGNIVREELQEELDRITKVGDTEVLKDTVDNFYVYFINTYRYYNVDIDGNVEGPVEVDRAVDNSPGDITKDKDGNALSGDTEDDAYQINCIEDLCALSNSCNNGITYSKKYIKLMINLDFKSDLSYVNGKISTEGNIPSCNSIEELRETLTTGNGFYAIGFKTGYNFHGTFNGKYHKITNLYENFEESDIIGGLFGDSFRGAIIKNITVEGNININNKDNTKSVAGISGSGAGVTFINCVNKVNVKVNNTSAFVGGIAGSAYEESKLINCINHGKIEGGRFNAGILGWDWSKSSLIYNCINGNDSTVAITRNIYTDDKIQIFNTINTGKCASVTAGNINQIKNCFNLKGSAIGNEYIIDYEETQMKSKEFVDELNTFIETEGNGENIDTEGWAKWIYNENNFPTLDMKTTWDGAKWITNNK